MPAGSLKTTNICCCLACTGLWVLRAGGLLSRLEPSLKCRPPKRFEQFLTRTVETTSSDTRASCFAFADAYRKLCLQRTSNKVLFFRQNSVASPWGPQLFACPSRTTARKQLNHEDFMRSESFGERVGGFVSFL